jgi:hypothetical protein
MSIMAPEMIFFIPVPLALGCPQREPSTGTLFLCIPLVKRFEGLS